MPDGWAAATVYPAPVGRVITTDPAEPNRIREQHHPTSVTRVSAHYSVHSTSGGDGGADESDGDGDGDVVLVEFAQLFVGWLEITGMEGAPGSTVTINTSSLPFVKMGPTPQYQYYPQYNMQHQYVFDKSGKGMFMPRFSYHEVKHVAITGLAKGCSPSIVGHRVGNIGHLHYANANAKTKNNANDNAGAGDADVDGGRVRTGWFTSSNTVLNSVYNVSMYTMASLVTGGISVDCPHRERLG
jgi:hypothetical protein